MKSTKLPSDKVWTILLILAGIAEIIFIGRFSVTESTGDAIAIAISTAVVFTAVEFGLREDNKASTSK